MIEEICFCCCRRRTVVVIIVVVVIVAAVTVCRSHCQESLGPGHPQTLSCVLHSNQRC